ncbi:MAG: hypothetical protein JWN70_442 [Planctomycetaceae bacterium]|nr:hypothetical protein [Planctomycetaceae bacterium]
MSRIVHKDVMMATTVRYFQRSNRSNQVLAWSYKKSRDGWKQKAVDLRRDIKVLKVRVADVVKSRDAWRDRAEAAERELVQSQQRTRELEAELAQKKRLPTLIPK